MRKVSKSYNYELKQTYRCAKFVNDIEDWQHGYILEHCLKDTNKAHGVKTNYRLYQKHKRL